MNKEKEIYVRPEFQLVEVEVEGMIATSVFDLTAPDEYSNGVGRSNRWGTSSWFGEE